MSNIDTEHYKGYEIRVNYDMMTHTPESHVPLLCFTDFRNFDSSKFLDLAKLCLDNWNKVRHLTFFHSEIDDESNSSLARIARYYYTEPTNSVQSLAVAKGHAVELVAEYIAEHPQSWSEADEYFSRIIEILDALGITYKTADEHGCSQGDAAKYLAVANGPADKENTEAILAQEIRDHAHVLFGRVYEFEICDEDGDVIEAGNFIIGDAEEAMNEGKACVEEMLAYEQQAA